MDWVEIYHKEQNERKKTKKAKTKQKILDDLKKKDYLEKKQELEVLKKRILELEKDLENYK